MTKTLLGIVGVILISWLVADRALTHAVAFPAREEVTNLYPIQDVKVSKESISCTINLGFNISLTRKEFPLNSETLSRVNHHLALKHSFAVFTQPDFARQEAPRYEIRVYSTTTGKWESL